MPRPVQSLLIDPLKGAAAHRHHVAGWSDRRIAHAISVCREAVKAWREANDLSANGCKKIDHERALALYAAGASDAAIAKAFDVIPNAVRNWRTRRSLRANFEVRPACSEATRQQARKMLRQGAFRRQVADAVGVGLSTIDVVRRKMRTRDGLRQASHSVSNDCRRAQRTDPSDLLARIRRAIGTKVASDIADDAVGEIILAVFEGRFSIDEIEERARSFGNRTISQFASKWGNVSLDESNADGLRLIDFIVDERAEAEIEAAGAAVMERREVS